MHKKQIVRKSKEREERIEIHGSQNNFKKSNENVNGGTWERDEPCSERMRKR